jgi:hypothetical protein
MVKHTKAAMASSAAMQMQAKAPMISSKALPCVIRINRNSGRELPHIAFANLPRDTAALAHFRKLWTKPLLGYDEASKLGVDEDGGTPRPEDSKEYVDEVFARQEWLRKAWQDDAVASEYLKWGGELPMAAKWELKAGRIEINPDTVWKATCICFLADEAAQRTAICQNPECVVPYFVKKRRSQKICGAGPCTDWVRRQVALRWWNKHGNAWRAKRKGRARSKGKKP